MQIEQLIAMFIGFAAIMLWAIAANTSKNKKDDD